MKFLVLVFSFFLFFVCTQGRIEASTDRFGVSLRDLADNVYPEGEERNQQIYHLSMAVRAHARALAELHLQGGLLGSLYPSQDPTASLDWGKQWENIFYVSATDQLIFSNPETILPAENFSQQAEEVGLTLAQFSYWMWLPEEELFSWLQKIFETTYFESVGDSFFSAAEMRCLLFEKARLANAIHWQHFHMAPAEDQFFYLLLMADEYQQISAGWN